MPSMAVWYGPLMPCFGVDFIQVFSELFWDRFSLPLLLLVSRFYTRREIYFYCKVFTIIIIIIIIIMCTLL